MGERELEVVGVGDRGVAVYPGQSGEDVLRVAEVIQRELDVGHYVARDVARKVLLLLGRNSSD